MVAARFEPAVAVEAGASGREQHGRAGLRELSRPVDRLGEVVDDLGDGDRGERGGDAIGGVAGRDDRIDCLLYTSDAADDLYTV